MKQLALPLLLVAGLTACGGGGEAEPTATAATAAAGMGMMPWVVVSPTAANVVGSIPLASPTASASAVAASPTVSAPTLTPEERAEAEALLKAASLRPEDMPEGFPLEYEIFVANEEVAEIGGMWVEMFGSVGGVALEDLYSSGRILGYYANYEAERPADPSSFSFSGTESFYVNVELFRESSAAHGYLELSRQWLANPDEMAASQWWEQLQEFYEGFGLEVRDLSVSSIAFAEAGDERLAFEAKFTMLVADLDTDFHVVLQGVGVRRDRAVGSVGVGAVNSSPSTKQLEDLARTLDERMKDALE